MPILLDGIAGGGASAAFAPMRPDVVKLRPPRTGDILIGLVNNMPDSALLATERQFVGLLAAAAGERTVRVQLYCLPGIARGEAAAAHLRECYAEIDELDRRAPDALIVTGCEPRAASLADEPYWNAMTQLVDWAERHTVSTIWSCLAAHAAVLYRDGIGRHRLPAKRSGVFDCEAVERHPLLDGAPKRLTVSHSRWNDLREADLRAGGYTILTASPEAGVNLFVKQTRSLHVHFQGHPEYDPDSIGREYRRDVARYLRGERPDYPPLPATYFDDATVAALEATRTLALADRRAVSLRDLPKSHPLRPGLAENWGQSALPVFRNWLGLIAEGRNGLERRAAGAARIG